MTHSGACSEGRQSHSQREHKHWPEDKETQSSDIQISCARQLCWDDSKIQAHRQLQHADSMSSKNSRPLLLNIIHSRGNCNTDRSRSFMPGQTRTMLRIRSQSTRGGGTLYIPSFPSIHPTPSLDHGHRKSRASHLWQLRITTTSEGRSVPIIISLHGYMRTTTTLA